MNIQGLLSMNYSYQNQIKLLQSAINKSNERLSTGKRINSAEDDPTAILRMTRLEAQIRGNQVAQNNIQDGMAFLDMKDLGLDNAQKIGKDLRDLAVKYNNDTLSTGEKEGILEAATSLIEELSDTFKNTKFNGINVFDKDLHIQTGANSNESFILKRTSIASLGGISDVEPSEETNSVDLGNNVNPSGTQGNGAGTGDQTLGVNSPTDPTNPSPTTNPSGTPSQNTLPSGGGTTTTTTTTTTTNNSDSSSSKGRTSLLGGITDLISNIFGGGKKNNSNSTGNSTTTTVVTTTTGGGNDTGNPNGTTTNNPTGSTNSGTTSGTANDTTPSGVNNTANGDEINNNENVAGGDIDSVLSAFLNTDILDQYILEPIAKARTQIGVERNILEHRLNFGAKEIEINSNVYSRIVDVDEAKEAMEKAKNEMLLQTNIKLIDDMTEQSRSNIYQLLYGD